MSAYHIPKTKDDLARVDLLTRLHDAILAGRLAQLLDEANIPHAVWGTFCLQRYGVPTGMIVRVSLDATLVNLMESTARM